MAQLFSDTVLPLSVAWIRSLLSSQNHGVMGRKESADFGDEGDEGPLSDKLSWMSEPSAGLLSSEAVIPLFSALQRARSEHAGPEAESTASRHSAHRPRKDEYQPRRSAKEPRPIRVKACVKRGERQATAAKLLVSCKFKNRVAAQLGVNSRTLRRWRKQLGFQRMLAECQANGAGR